MNYEQIKHKIKNCYNDSKNLQQNVDKVNYIGENLNREKIVQKISYLESIWLTLIRVS
jgi:hypothetical protein